MSSTPPSTVDSRENRALYIHVALGICITLAGIGVAARIYCRRMLRVALNASDYFIIAGFVAALALFSLAFASINVGWGRHVDTITSEQLETFLKIFFAAEIFYVLPITLTKISILLLYRSIFPGREIAIAINIIGVVVVAWAVACINGVIFSCIPVQGYWDLSIHARCINSTKFFIGNAIPNMVTDTCILLLPVRPVWTLQLSTQRKILVSSMFLLGGFVIVASILRLALLFNEDLNDPTWGLVNAFTWSNVEVDVAVLSACLPTLRPLFKKIWPSSMGTMAAPKQNPYPSDPYSKISAQNQKKHRFLSLPSETSASTSVSGPENGEEQYGMEGITVLRQFSAVSGEASV